jgi:hypothetical protein
MLRQMIARTIAGFGVVEADRGGRRYVYPPDYPNIERIEASIELSASHDDGDVEGLKVDPDRYAAQDAYFSSGRAQSPDFVRSMAEVIDSRFGGLVDDVLSDDRRTATLRKIGDHLAAGGNLINAVPHGPLLDIGLLHAMAYIGLARLGYNAKIGIVISHGVAGRGKRFNDELVCLADALDWACDKVWYVTPQTANARASSYAEVAADDHIRQRNAVVRHDIAETLDAGGALITVAPSATSTRRDAAGVHWLQTPTLGTMKLMSHPQTLVAVAVGRFLGASAPSYDLNEELRQLGGDAEALVTQGDALMSRMVDGMRAVDPVETYEVGRPRVR